MAAPRMRRLICTWMMARPMAEPKTGQQIQVLPVFRLDVPQNWQVVCDPPRDGEPGIRFRVPQLPEAGIYISMPEFLVDYDVRTQRCATIEARIQDWIIALVAYQRRQELLSGADPECSDGWLMWLQAYERNTIYGRGRAPIEEDARCDGDQCSWE